MDTIEILVYIYAGLFGLTFCILIGLYVWMYNLSKQVKKNGKKNPYDAFLGTDNRATTENKRKDSVSASATVPATDLYRSFKMRQAQLRDSDTMSYTSRQTREENVQRYDNGSQRYENRGPNGSNQGIYGQPQHGRMVPNDQRGNILSNNQPQSMGDMIRGAKLVNRRYDQFD